MTSVVHCKKSHYDVYIGRPSKWGNPFSHLDGKGQFKVSNREEAVIKYREWIMKSDLLNDLHELENKILGCWCKPQLCHGDVLAGLINQKLLYEDQSD